MSATPTCCSGSTAAGSSLTHCFATGSLSCAAVQNYINARVPLLNQGGVFGMEKVVDNALTIVAMLTLGAIATVAGSQIVFIVAPVAVLGFVIWLIRYSSGRAGQAIPTTGAVVEELWAGPAGDEGAESATEATEDR